ncbi:MAG TPA: hypothetical protein VGG38_15070 [Acidimicrobiales bacterium]
MALEAKQPIIVAGGSIAGLATALAFGRLGHEVTVLERDALVEADDAEAAFGIERVGAPQAHQTHGFLARLSVVLRQHFPDIYEKLRTSGAEAMTLTSGLGEPQPGDEDLSVLIVRRTTLEWLLREAVRAEPHVTYRSEVGVDGLLVTDDGAAVTHVRGVRLSDGTELTGDVVACTGRRGAETTWLAAHGVDIAEKTTPTHIVYLTRWYRRPEAMELAVDARLGGDFGYLKYLAIPCDGSTFSVTLAVRAKDSELRSRLLEPGAFDRACRILPGPDRFFALEGVEALGPVRPMGGLINRIRYFTDRTGAPLVTGFAAVGDAHTCTNPMYGRGCSLAFVQATLLADAYAAHPDDASARAATYAASCTREVEPWYHSAVLMDGMGDSDGIPKEPDPISKKFGALVADVMLGRGADPIIARGLLRMINTLTRPDELMSDGEFMTAVASYFAGPESDLSDLDALRVSRGTLLEAAAA